MLMDVEGQAQVPVSKKVCVAPNMATTDFSMADLDMDDVTFKELLVHAVMCMWLCVYGNVYLHIYLCAFIKE